MHMDLLHAQLQMIEVDGHTVQSNKTNVRLDKMNAKGMRFFSELRFPIYPQIIFLFHVVMFDESITLKGYINWNQRKGDMHAYDVVFIDDEVTKSKLVHQLHSLARQYSPLRLKATHAYEYFMK